MAERSLGNRRTAEFRSERPGFQAAPTRSRVRRSALPKSRHHIQTRGDVILPIRERASLAFARPGFHFDSDHSLIVECVDTGGVLGHRLEYLGHYTPCRLGDAPAADRRPTLRPNRMTVAVARVQ